MMRNRNVITLILMAALLLGAFASARAEGDLYVKRVEGLPEDFIFGMDASIVIAEENSGVKYYGFDGEVYSIASNDDKLNRLPQDSPRGFRTSQTDAISSEVHDKANKDNITHVVHGVKLVGRVVLAKIAIPIAPIK